MPVAPGAASGSRSDLPATEAPQRLSASRRLRSPAQFTAVTSDPKAIRAGRRWLSIVSRVRVATDTHAPVRFGFTAARRHARRAVDRNTVKRVLREVARRRLTDLDAAAGNRQVDVVLRLKATVPSAEAMPRTAWKAALRDEADALLDALACRLREAVASPR